MLAPIFFCVLAIIIVILGFFVGFLNSELEELRGDTRRLEHRFDVLLATINSLSDNIRQHRTTMNKYKDKIGKIEREVSTCKSQFVTAESVKSLPQGRRNKKVNRDSTDELMVERIC